MLKKSKANQNPFDRKRDPLKDLFSYGVPNGYRYSLVEGLVKIKEKETRDATDK